MLTSFTLKNFKSFKEATLHLTPTVTFLIGANGSGKSNALEALRLINWLGDRGSLEYLEKNSIVRGTSNDLFLYNQKSFDINTIINEGNDEYDFIITIELQEKKKGNTTVNTPYITREFLQKVKNGKNDIIYSSDIIYSLDPKTIISSMRKQDRSRAFFGDIPSITFFMAVLNSTGKKKFNIEKIQKGAQILNDHLTSIFFLEPDPKEMRGYVQQFERMSLSESADNLSDVLEKLCRNRKIKKDILEMVCSLPEQKILDINFSKTQENWLMLRLDESFGDKRHTTPAYSLSDGTLRALAIATALYSAPEGSLLVIEEVDNGIHPSRIKHLVDKMYEIAAERKIQILVTTHDPAMMDAIPQQEIGNVLCCYRDKEDGSSKIVRLSDSPQYMDVLFNGRLGNQVVSREFEENIKKTSEERKTEHEAWVKQYEKEQEEYDKALKKALGEE